MCDQQRLRSACANAQSDQGLCLSLEHSMTIKLLTEQHFEFLPLKGDWRGSSEFTHVKMTHCWKSHVTAHIMWILLMYSGLNGKYKSFISFVISVSLFIAYLISYQGTFYMEYRSYEI